MSAAPKYIIDKRIDWHNLSRNPNADALRLLEQNPERISWLFLSENPGAIHLLEQSPERIDWYWLSCNPNALHLLEQNPEKISWQTLSLNPSAMHLLAPLDYPTMKVIMQPFCQELVEYVFHPTRVFRIANCYGMDLNEYLEFL